ncbi:hypothetical protein AB0469_18790 [Streptomyces sp. NPDC093801]|uniref:hypothetical protein n=1 Tax=Streptomyces sp. NPDC093801 TaxID=3155203 RepID=UPI00344E087A
MTGSFGTDRRAWQDSRDRRQEWYAPDREERFRVMPDTIEAPTGPAPRVPDLACGTGSITVRLLERFPVAVATGLDPDPALPAPPAAGPPRRSAPAVRPGGVFVNAHPMPDACTPRIDAAEARFAVYGEHAGGESPDAARHARALRAAGFAEARTVWRSPSDAPVLGPKQ